MKHRCSWCNRELGEDHGYSRDNLPVCASYSNPPTKEYNRCKAAKSRNKTSSKQPDAPEGHSLHDGIQIMIDQLYELIMLQKQALSQPRQTVLREETNTIKTTTLSTPDLDFDISLLDVQGSKDNSANETFKKRLEGLIDTKESRMQ